MYPEGTRSELLASGEYESEHDRIMKGFRIFQKKYVYKNVIIQMILLFIAAVIQVVGIINDGFSPVCGFIIIALIGVLIFVLGTKVFHAAADKRQRSLGTKRDP